MPTPPNLVIFLTDDHGQWAAHCYGNAELWTPAMNHLANSGVRMEAAFTPSPVCSPARASFFTGRVPSQHGIHDYLDMEELGARHPAIDGQKNLGQYLQDLGYQTAMIGKWHCGRSWQRHEGFDDWMSLAQGTNAIFGDHQFNHNGSLKTMHGHQAPMLTDEAISFLRRRDSERPFCLFVGFTNTHSPHIGEARRLVEHYRLASFDDIPNETHHGEHGVPRIVDSPNPTRHREALAQYYAAVTAIDEQIGRVLDELEGLQQRDNTLVVYTADHGHMNGHHGLHRKGNGTVPQNFLDESIRVPCLLSWPEAIPAGRSLSQPVDHCDLFRTLLDVAGQPDPEGYDGPGQSYLPTLRGEDQPWRDAWFGEYGNARAIGTATHKLIRRAPGLNGHFPDELYDLVQDPRETTNRFDDPLLAEVQTELIRRLEQHFTQYEIPERSGWHIADQPQCNTKESWQLDPAAIESMTVF